MAKLVIIWPKISDQAAADAFDEEFVATHVPLAVQLPGGSFFSGRVAVGDAARVTVVDFPDEATLRAALKSDIGGACGSNAQGLRDKYGIKPTTLIVP